MTGDRPTRLDRRLLRALELHAADATWEEIARTPLTPQDPTPLYPTAAAAQDAVEDELAQLRTQLAKLRIPGLKPADDRATVLAQLEAAGLSDDAVARYLLHPSTKPDRRRTGDHPLSTGRPRARPGQGTRSVSRRLHVVRPAGRTTDGHRRA